MPKPLEFRTEVESRKRAQSVIAQESLTNSKRPSAFVDGVYPTHALCGYSCYLTDTQGRKYVDFVCGLGTNLLGYGQPTVTEATIAALKNGATLSLSSADEVRLGEKIREIMQFVERIKLLKSGSEGCTAAVRIARAFTGKSLVLSEGYHGWHDEFISFKKPALGVVNDYQLQPLLDLAQIDDDIAAVIVEPVITDFSEARVEWLKRLREICTKKDVVLIFDETITAMRFPNFCVANWASVHPDLIVFGKAVANGMPLSIVGGKKEIMECGEYFVSSSFAGERASINAAISTITLLQTKFNIGDLWESGKEFQRRFAEIIRHAYIEGYPTRGILTGIDLDRALFMQEACKAGLLFGASWFYAFPHMNDTHSILSTLTSVALKLKMGGVKLEGSLPRSPFAQQMRERTL